MSERVPEAELVLDDELVFDDGPRRSTLLRREERPDQLVREGEVLAGKYRVERIPGRNGLGVVVQVRHLELGQEVTLKFLVPDACAYPEFVQRFVREARAAVKIQGEHVARVTDVGRLDSGAPYMVREYLRGPDLAEVLKVRGPLPVEEAVDYVIQACEGVAEGHALGVVHRNLRPTSLVVTRRSDGMPLVKVFDFAAAESLHVDPFTERAVSLVGTSAIMASLPYLAPEQIRDPHDVDVRADVYSLGAILFELLAGQPVYAADSAPALLAMVAADAAPPLRTLRPDAPGELDHIVLRCLAKNRAIRYPNISDLVLALKEFASADTIASVERVVRLNKRMSKAPELGSSAARSLPPSPPAPVVAPLQPFAPSPSAGPTRGTTGTVVLRAEDGGRGSARPAHPVGNEDVTTISPYAAYNAAASAPIILETRSQALEPRVSERAAAPEPRVSERAAPEPRVTPQPPPLRASAPPPLRAPTPVPPPLRKEASVAAPPLATPPPARPSNPTLPLGSPALGAQPQAQPLGSVPPRNSMSGLSRSWAVADEPSPPLFTKKRLIAVGVVAACATLGAVFAFRGARSAPVAAAAPAKPLPPPAPPPNPAPPPEVAPAPEASVAAAASAAPSVAPLPVAAAPVPAAPVAAQPAPAPAPAAPAPAPAKVAPAALAAALVVPKPAPKPAAPRVESAPARRTAVAKAETEGSRTVAASDKVASARPASADLFEDPR
jgi:serine/threonine-protein kinase